MINIKMRLFKPLFIVAIVISTLIAIFAYGPEWLAGDLHSPKLSEAHLSKGAKSLIEKAFRDITPPWVDYHAHLVAFGSEELGFVSSGMQTWLNPIERLKFEVYRKASGVSDLAKANEEYVARLEELIGSFPQKGKIYLFAIDKHYTKQSEVDLLQTPFYVSNDYVWQVANKQAYFVPVISIHPYRNDAIQELNHWHQKGVKYVKWLPNSMGIDPSDPRLDDYYHALIQNEMVLITHAGEERAVKAHENQALGNPLLLRKPLKQGVKVIIAHAASLGQCEDIESKNKIKVPCFDLFIRLMDDKQYLGNLFADISALTHANRSPAVLAELLDRTDLHPRLLNGSDYPLPAINILIHTQSLQKNRFITREERRYLNEIYQHNPLLFDFVLKRTIHSPDKKQTFSANIFMPNPKLP